MNKKEFENSLLSRNVVEEYLNSSNEELEKTFGNQFMRTVNFGSQNNKEHQYDLFEHILRTVDNIQTNHLSRHDVVMIKVAAFFHDIGKPNVAKVNEQTGQTQYFNHAKESAKLAKDILEKFGFNSLEIKEISFLIESHDEFIQMKNITDATLAKVLNKKTKLGFTISNFRKLIILCRADVMAQKDIITENGNVIDTRVNKLDKLEIIEALLPKSIVLTQQKELNRLKKQLKNLEIVPKPININGKVVNQGQIDNWYRMKDEEKISRVTDIKDKINKLKEEVRFLLEN